MLTHDPEQAAGYDADPLIFRQIAVNILLDLHDTSTRLLADAGAITVPTLLLVAGSDWVVKTAAQETFFNRISSSVMRLEKLPGFYHAIFHEKGRQLAVSKARDFILECFARSPQRDGLIEADKHGFTFNEYERLCRPAGPKFRAVRRAMKTLGRLSCGIRLGWEAGFDSGRTLDYIYQNKPQGITPLGRAFDRAYLNTIGWRGIRARKTSLKDVLREAIEKVHHAGCPVRVLDIASGPGRYVLEAIRELDQGTPQNLSLPHECGVPRAAGTPHSCGSGTPSKQSLERPPDHIPVTLLLRDYKQENVQAARCLAHDLGVRNVEAVQGDAFDRASLAALRPRPTVAIVSGLYELFPSNEPVLNSLRGLADAMEPGSYLVYTNQPWHPQVEFIARVLTNREGKPWIMRRRTQAEMEELVREAGFAKERQEIAPWGIFSVSLARRIKS